MFPDAVKTTSMEYLIIFPLGFGSFFFIQLLEVHSPNLSQYVGFNEIFDFEICPKDLMSLNTYIFTYRAKNRLRRKNNHTIL